MAEQASDSPCFITPPDDFLLGGIGPDPISTSTHEQYIALGDEIFQNTPEFTTTASDMQWNSMATYLSQSTPLVEHRPEMHSLVSHTPIVELGQYPSSKTELPATSTLIPVARQVGERATPDSSQVSSDSSINTLQRHAEMDSPRIFLLPESPPEISTATTTPSVMTIEQPSPSHLTPPSTAAPPRTIPPQEPTPDTNLVELARAIRDSIVAESNQRFEERVAAAKAERLPRHRPIRSTPMRISQHCPSIFALRNVPMQQFPPLPMNTIPSVPFQDPGQTAPLPIYSQFGVRGNLPPTQQLDVQHLPASSIPALYPYGMAPYPWPLLALPTNSPEHSMGLYDTFQAEGHSDGRYFLDPQGCTHDAIGIRSGLGSSAAMPVEFGACQMPSCKPMRSNCDARNGRRPRRRQGITVLPEGVSKRRCINNSCVTCCMYHHTLALSEARRSANSRLVDCL